MLSSGALSRKTDCRQCTRLKKEALLKFWEVITLWNGRKILCFPVMRMILPFFLSGRNLQLFVFFCLISEAK
ncbi:hypothetical protein ASG21_11330 [Chryseobacterium sp. Leaf394]|nr:hypothetical protein ASG21_11330 [Chryseobacterium sp. Leaf394]